MLKEEVEQLQKELLSILVQTIKDKKLTYRAAAPLCGMKPSMLHAVCTGHRSPNLKTFLTAIVGLGISDIVFSDMRKKYATELKEKQIAEKRAEIAKLMEEIESLQKV